MVKRFFFIVLITFLSIHLAFTQTVGLVLSGGGAKGAVHIGMIKALEDNNIPIDYIAGTSVGAIVGSMYAMGYSPEEMLELFISDEFYYWQTGKVEEDYQFYFRQNKTEPDFMKINVPFVDSVKITKLILPNSLISPIQMNQAFLQLFSQANGKSGGDFNKLFVPFLCVASDIYNKRPVIFRNGDLGDAVRASMTFPFVFKPITKDGIPLFDGGIYDNFPVNPMKRAWNPDVIIGCTVAGNKHGNPAEQGMYDQMENMIMQQTQYKVDKEDGIMLKFELDDVSLLDFYRSKALYKMGYDRTVEMIDSIKNRIERQVPLAEIEVRREEFKASLPKLIFKDIYISGTTEGQKAYIESQIHRNDNNEFTFDDFKKMYFRLLTNSKIKEISPHALYDPENETFDLFLDIQISEEIAIAFGGNISSMNANQIYMGLSYLSMSTISANYNLDIQLGNSFTGIALDTKMEIPSDIPMDISGMIVYNYRNFFESQKLFIDTDIGTFITQQEVFGKLGIGLPFQSKARTDLLFGVGELDDHYYQEIRSTYSGIPFDRSKYLLFNAGIHYIKNSLDAKQYPILGHNHLVYAQYITGKETFQPSKNIKNSQSYSQSYIQINACINNYHALSSKFNLGYVIEGVLSSKNLWNNYTSSVLQAPSFTPTPHSKVVFNEAFRANQYFAAGLTPIFKLNSTIHLRGDFDFFSPIYPIKRGEKNKAYYGNLFSELAYLGEISVVAQLPFVSISLFSNYYSYPKNNWNVGLNIGYLIFGPKFIP